MTRTTLRDRTSIRRATSTVLLTIITVVVAPIALLVLAILSLYVIQFICELLS